MAKFKETNYVANRIQMVEKLKDIFKYHIGISSAISSEDLYFQITGAQPGDTDYYEREYKWNAIKRILSFLRKEGILFVVMGTNYHYVLDSQDELDAYRNRVDATIKGLTKMKSKAGYWVNSPELRELKEEAKRKPKPKKKEAEKKKVVVKAKVRQ